ncbi:MAG: hypothetical protein ACOC71_09300 [Hyphomicrobiales bacterium]
MTTYYHDENGCDKQLTLAIDSEIPDGAYDGAQQADDNAEAGWREQALREIETMARSRIPFTADDVRERVGSPDHPNRWGGVFLAARRAGLIEVVNVRPSATPSRHASLVRVWRGLGA